jgi:hypothetical protein
MVRPSFSPFRLAFAALLAFTAGCATPALDDPARVGPFFSPANHAGEAQLPATLRRVVLMPLAGGGAAGPESVAALDPVFLAELQKQNRFEIVPMTRDDCLHHFHAEEFSSTAALPANFLDFVRRQYAADAVLFVDVTVFKPYRPIALGVRAKLATLGDDVKLLWTFDNIFSTADAAVSNAARHHFLDSDRRGLPGDSTQAVLESPSRFASYVAAAMFATLPPVNAPAPATATAPKADGVANPR